jgi:acyl dehydratase
VGAQVEVTGRCVSIRTRGAVNLAGFEFEAATDAGPWARGSSVFLLSPDAVTALPEEEEPPVGLRPRVEPTSPMALPTAGKELPTVGVGASRLDLVRYASSSGDWNPIHWDHESARGAGLPGTIVHGLLMSAWIARASARFVAGPHPLASMRVRFRFPLRPGVAAELGGSVMDADDDGADLELAIVSGGDRMVTARVRVTR